MYDAAHCSPESTEAVDRETDAERLEGEIAEVCGLLNATMGRLIGLIGRVLGTGAWAGEGVRSAEHWVAWRCGVSPGRARALVAMARRLPELPETRAALESGELSEDQVRVVCRHVPVRNDAEVAEFARSATVTQLQRTMSSYAFEPTPESSEPVATEEERRVSFGTTDDGGWRLSARLPADEGAMVERALAVTRDALFRDGEEPGGVSWADALVGVADGALHAAATAAGRHQRDRTLVLVHLDAEKAGGPRAHLHLGPGLPDGLRRYLCCDTRVRPVWEVDGAPVSVGRSQRTVPDRTRVAVEERDRGCRVPGCARSRWLEVHHVVHWEDGGATDTNNLVALCRAHHRLHHTGRLGITGDADQPTGLLFTDHHGWPLTANGRPTPPGDPPEPTADRLGIQPGTWAHPTGERLRTWWVQFSDPPSPN